MIKGWVGTIVNRIRIIFAAAHLKIDTVNFKSKFRGEIVNVVVSHCVV